MATDTPTLDKLYDAALADFRANSPPEHERLAFIDSCGGTALFAVHVSQLNSQWLNGGLAQWLDNGYGTPCTFSYLHRALQRVGTPAAQEVQALLVCAQAADKDHDCRDADEREERGDSLDRLDDVYYGYSLRDLGLNRQRLHDEFMNDCERHAAAGRW